MPRTLRHLNRTPWTVAEQSIILRPGITEHQAAAALWAELGSRRSASAVGTERRRLGAAGNDQHKGPPQAVPLDAPVRPLLEKRKDDHA